MRRCIRLPLPDFRRSHFARRVVLAHDIIAALGRAIAAPSANRSGSLSPTRAEHVIEQLGDAVALVVDAGPCEVGLESTIVSLVGKQPQLLRPGGVSAEAIESALGAKLKRASLGDPISAPGMLASHYAPHLPLRMSATSVTPGEALLAFGNAPIADADHAVVMRNLSPSGDLVEAAANLFAFLAELDRSAASAIAVAPVPDHGLGEAINDRLSRAAVPTLDNREPPRSGNGQPAAGVRTVLREKCRAESSSCRGLGRPPTWTSSKQRQRRPPR